MPFYGDFSVENATVVLYRLGEAEVPDEKILSAAERIRTAEFHPKKKAEFIAVRQLLNEVMPGHTIAYEATGAPVLADTGVKISITHSYPFAGIALSQTAIGLDIERIQPKFLKVAHKFLNAEELRLFSDDAEKLTTAWAVKEALYKIHPSKLWSLKAHYNVEDFEIDDDFTVRCSIFSKDFHHNYMARILRIEDYVLAVVTVPFSRT